MYESEVTFILDTVCPWTFIAKKRLDQALSQVRDSPSSSNVNFTLRFQPFQLYPDLPESANKKEWYLHNKHLDNPKGQALFQASMANLAEPLGVAIDWDGEMGNTFQAHRVIQHVQEEKGPEVTEKLVDGLYRRYFCEARHPATKDTLTEALVEAGVAEDEAKKIVQDQDVGKRDVDQKLKTVAMDNDAVPVVMVEGKRRDITLTGAKEVREYVKALETVIKESS